jgi:pimeloyl-ACP methyl ester carboxylesterase
MRVHTLVNLGPHGFHRTRYYEWGERDNPRVVICVHGLTRNGRDFDALAQALAPHFRILCPDVVGRGQSDWLKHSEDYDTRLYSSDMIALVARSGADHVYWVGTSMGGIIGMSLAALERTPIARLVLNDIGPFVPKAALERIAGYVGKAGSFASMQAYERYLREVFAPFGELTAEQWRHLAEHSARRTETGALEPAYDPNIAVKLAGSVQDLDLWWIWKLASCPTLVLRGANSDVLPADTAKEMTLCGPKAKLRTFDKVGHAPALMAADQIEAVRDFLLAPP